MAPSLPVRLYAGSTQSVTALCRSTGNFAASRNRAGSIRALAPSAQRQMRQRQPLITQLRLSSGRRWEIGVGGEPDPECGDPTPDQRAQQRRKLFAMTVAGHSRDERWAALHCRMEIDFADAVRQVLYHPEDSVLKHAAAPSEAE